PQLNQQLAHEAEENRIHRGRVAEGEATGQMNGRVHQLELDDVRAVGHDVKGRAGHGNGVGVKADVWKLSNPFLRFAASSPSSAKFDAKMFKTHDASR